MYVCPIRKIYFPSRKKKLGNRLIIYWEINTNLTRDSLLRQQSLRQGGFFFYFFRNPLAVLKKLFIFAPANEECAIAQLVEQRTENPCVPGSIPGGTTFQKQSECSAVGSALRSGRRGRAFESPHSDRRRQTSKIGCRFFFFTFTNRCKWVNVKTDQRKNLRDFISMHIIFVQFLIERVSDLTIAYLFYIISTFTKDIRKQSPIT